MKPDRRFAGWMATCALAALVGTAGCQSVQTTQPGAVGVDRTQRMAVGSEEIESASAQAYRQMLREAAAKGLIDRRPVAIGAAQRPLRVEAFAPPPIGPACRQVSPEWGHELSSQSGTTHRQQVHSKSLTMSQVRSQRKQLQIATIHQGTP